MKRNPLLEYLRKNPYTWDTKHGFRHRLCLPEEEIDKLLESLLSKDLLEVRGEGEQALYGPSSKKHDLLKRTSTEPWDRYGLTARETDVAQCLLKGMLNNDIAEALHISNHTVKNHLTNIFKKLGVYDRAQAVVKLGNFADK